MDERRLSVLGAILLLAGVAVASAEGCAQGTVASFGDGGFGGEGGDSWGGPAGPTTSGSGGASGSSSSSSDTTGAGTGSSSSASVSSSSGGSCMPYPEVCNGLDDDCDGAPDDGNPGGGGSCSTGMPGACADGTTTCSGGTIQCLSTLQPVPEVCGDSTDNDCDGTVDNGCGGTGSCAHDPCVAGGPLDPSCDSCADLICSLLDDYCCTTAWDSTCADYAFFYCTC